MPAEPIVFPPCLYPAFAPLSIPMANHLLLLEERKYHRRPTKRPASPEMLQTVLERISRARTVVYEYLRPFVAADKKRQQRGESRVFPSQEWVLETLAFYAPNGVKNDEETLDDWQKRSLLRREKTRGRLDMTSLATLFIVRLAEEVHLRNWLPTCVTPEEPWWWCYGQDAPGASVEAIPLPLPGDLPPSLVIWTPWQGAIWEQEWQLHGRDGNLYRWANPPGLEGLQVWDKQLPAKIQACKEHPLFGRPAVQRVLLEEARHMVLTDVADVVQKGIICYEGLNR